MQEHSTIPLGLCQCGCGQPTKIAIRSHPQQGKIKGQPLRFIYGHQSRGKNNPRYKPLEERFWAKVEKSPELNDCWVWTGAKNADGYGTICAWGAAQLVHRVSWHMANGSIPEGICILHHCDNPPCIRPDHLFEGTMQDNTMDMVRKGRRYWKNRQPGTVKQNAKLTKEDVIAIRDDYNPGQMKQLAKRFGVCRETIFNILHRKTWSHVVCPIKPVS